MRMNAFNLAQIDKEHDMAKQAWMNHQVTATKTSGSGKNQKTEPVYKNFKDFFDYEKKLREVDGEQNHKLSKRQRRMVRTAAILNAKGG